MSRLRRRTTEHLVLYSPSMPHPPGKKDDQNTRRTCIPTILPLRFARGTRRKSRILERRSLSTCLPMILNFLPFPFERRPRNPRLPRLTRPWFVVVLGEQPPEPIEHQLR